MRSTINGAWQAGIFIGIIISPILAYNMLSESHLRELVCLALSGITLFFALDMDSVASKIPCKFWLKFFSPLKADTDPKASFGHYTCFFLTAIISLFCAALSFSFRFH
ncbi:hypothetical protein VCHA53O466_140078 [Vibrio chagasii]|nr:hypothetical protein VCHA53O466_140078 [Vibrio chagasii]